MRNSLLSYDFVCQAESQRCGILRGLSVNTDHVECVYVVYVDQRRYDVLEKSCRRKAHCLVGGVQMVVDILNLRSYVRLFKSTLHNQIQDLMSPHR